MMTGAGNAARKAPEGHVERPTLKMSDWSRARRWWKPETGIPQRCTACNAQLAVEPPGAQRYGRVWCVIGCGREYAFVSAVGWAR